ncbi:ABC transporter permease [Luteolibacter flavescens]|uniref:Transport permease protein n=1 Tax=Luteolibacter flavescens TaxID=1859460 RepID=A0ABT3FK06_9BACT|nr:ABC transporter permease [Luteolibacter flavescens]MCW1883887.1 ABC transporter permease [Luteolibacter flavescens]
MNELLLSLRLSWHVVVRNWTVYRKDFLANISPTLADPALILGSLGMGLSGFVGQIDGMSYAQFLAPGMIATTALFTAFFESSYGFYVRMTFESVFKAMLTTPIGVKEVVTGEFMWVFVRAGLMGLGVALVLLALGLLPNPLAILICPLIAGTLALPCAAIGLLASAWVRNINQFQTVYSFLIAPIFYLSGVFFPVQSGSALGTVVQFSPFYHGVKLIQYTVWGRADWSAILWHSSLLLAFVVVLCGISFRFIGRKLTT